ncbi:MAG TPA: hypothetical protein PKE06_04305 [Flavilitoribacter sp.]|nr:hypothetical protein [Flavilitoribacter sp.]HMQ90241.1 hypothetical protein [Flavilitoribacter sp.]
MKTTSIKPGIVLTSFLFLLAAACTNAEKNRDLPANDEPTAEKQAEEIPGEPYPDAMAESIVQEIMEENQPVNIDSFADLHGFDLSRFKTRECTDFTLDLVAQNAGMDNPVSKAQHAILGVTDYYCDKSISPGFNAYVFYTRSMESHYGNAFELVTVDKSSNRVNRLVLSQEYLSEGYEARVESRFLDDRRIRVTKTELFNTSNNDPADDSTRVVKKLYRIEDGGGIVVEK